MKLVLGTMTFGESVGPEDAAAFVRTFLEAGGEELDTAYVYNEGRSERYLGEALKGMDRPWRVATKVHPRVTGRLDAEAARMQLGESLARLQLPCADIFYLHFPDPATPVECVLAACAEMHREGRFRELGLSNFPAWMTADVWHICDRNGWVRPTVYEGMYNPIARRAETELNACLDRFGMRYYAYNPLAGGLLTGRYARFEDEPADGRFKHRPNYQKRYWKRSAFEAVELLKDACGQAGITLTAAVYRWLAHHSMLRESRGDAVIIGASKAEHLRQNIAAAQEGPLPPAVVEAFDRAWEICRVDCPEYFTLYKKP